MRHSRRWMNYENRRDRFVMTPDLKHRLNVAFTVFRKLGFQARQNFSCCGGCAGYEMAERVGKMLQGDDGTKRLKIKGCVFYHRQDTERMNDDGDFYLSYGQLDVDGVGQVGLPTALVGEQVCEVLKGLSIPYEWDGNESSRIRVRLDLYGKTLDIVKV